MRSAHTQRCHESKACTSPATALYFSQNKQPQRQHATRTRAYSGRAQTVKGGEGGGQHYILPPSYSARLCAAAVRRSSAQHNLTPFPLKRPKYHAKRRWRATHKGGRARGVCTAVGCKADLTSTTSLPVPPLASGVLPSG